MSGREHIRIMEGMMKYDRAFSREEGRLLAAALKARQFRRPLPPGMGEIRAEGKMIRNRKPTKAKAEEAPGELRELDDGEEDLPF